jgi:hypothetical protein
MASVARGSMMSEVSMVVLYHSDRQSSLNNQLTTCTLALLRMSPRSCLLFESLRDDDAQAKSRFFGKTALGPCVS